MELKTAIEILEYHQKWRLGKREDMIHKPKKLTEALDIVLMRVKKLTIPVVMWRCNENITDLYQNCLFTKGLVYEQINVEGQFVLKDNNLQSTDCNSFDGKFSHAT